MKFEIKGRTIELNDELVKKYKETMLTDLSSDMVEYYLDIELEYEEKKLINCSDKEVKDLILSALIKDLQLRED